MKFTFSKLAVALFTLCLLVSAAGAQSVHITCKDGSRWRGQVSDAVNVTVVERGIENSYEGTIVRAGDRFITIDTMISGALRQKTIFFGDIVSITSRADATNNADDASASTAGTDSSSEEAMATTARDLGASQGKAASASKKPSAFGGPSGVFYLPLEGGVGWEIRHDEIKKIGEEADKHGPGQIIVLMINTNGGMVLESEMIDETIQELQKRHRVVAWVKKGISAGCSLAMACSEIYFMSEGVAGSVTTVMGVQSMQEGPELQKHIDALVETCKRNGYSEHIARAMKLNKYMCSYDKDPVTGDTTWYGDTSGRYVLSDDKSNLCFNASNALHAGVSKGTADTEADLARFLDLPEWKEVNDYGRTIADRWYRTAERATEDIQHLIARRGYDGASGTAVERLGKLIRINEQLIRWIDRAPNIAVYRFNLQKPPLQREIDEWRKQLADLQRQERGR